MKFMTYEELVEFIRSEETGIAKGYDFDFLRNKFELKLVKQTIERDLKLFKEIEKTLLQIATPKEGDFVKYDDGISRLSRIHSDGSIQLSSDIGVYVWHNGTHASGCVWDPNIKIERKILNIKNLVYTDEIKEGECWMFSQLQSGGNRGVYYKINFRLWELEDLL